MNKGYTICKRCVMDTSDPEIYFDELGYCNHCSTALDFRKKNLLSPTEKEAAFNDLIQQLKANGKNKKYDCIIGVSGGVDSTWVAYVLIQAGIRPLAVHLDNGWNAELAVSNIKKVLNFLNIELYTHVLDWEEFKDLQLSFLKASTPDSEIPTDHAIVSLLYKISIQEKLPLIIGTNHASESIMAKRWSQGHGDWKYIKTVQLKFGNKKLKDFPHTTLFQSVYMHVSKQPKVYNLLNYIDYDKEKAKKHLINELGWVDYGGKHYESIYTRIFQSYILPTKFGFDKRRAHFSSLIIVNQMSRQEALGALEKPSYNVKDIQNDIEYVIKKFDIDINSWKNIMNLPVMNYEDYSPSWNRWLLMNYRRIIRYASSPVLLSKKVLKKFLQ